MRAGYPAYPNAQKPPFVLRGDTLTANRFWLRCQDGGIESEVGRLLETQGKGIAVTSAKEDTGYLQALTLLSHAKRIDFARVMDLRTASDYELPPQGKDAVQLLAGEAHDELSGYKEALESAYLVGSRVVTRRACSTLATLRRSSARSYALHRPASAFTFKGPPTTDYPKVAFPLSDLTVNWKCRL